MTAPRDPQPEEPPSEESTPAHKERSKDERAANLDKMMAQAASGQDNEVTGPEVENQPAPPDANSPSPPSPWPWPAPPPLFPHEGLPVTPPEAQFSPPHHHPGQSAPQSGFPGFPGIPWDTVFDAVMYVNAAILGGVIGNRSDAGVVATFRWLARRRRRSLPDPLTDEELMERAIDAAVRHGYPRRRLRPLEVSRGGSATLPVALLRVTWSKTVLVVRVDTVHPNRSLVDPVRLFPPHKP
ncbi:hypothetical protein [Spirillospora sp. NPDC029432]|uniref:hypothetical protein n=1 Tax=Spirillospora sp. NPDC029432 TaxID=3154599 RepID=UPI0034561AA1